MYCTVSIQSTFNFSLILYVLHPSYKFNFMLNNVLVLTLLRKAFKLCQTKKSNATTYLKERKSWKVWIKYQKNNMSERLNCGHRRLCVLQRDMPCLCFILLPGLKSLSARLSVKCKHRNSSKQSVWTLNVWKICINVCNMFVVSTPSAVKVISHAEQPCRNLYNS